jgi:hypothetical protein
VTKPVYRAYRSKGETKDFEVGRKKTSGRVVNYEGDSWDKKRSIVFEKGSRDGFKATLFVWGLVE